ncbi:MAG: Rpn family recombination-promoting nuclease/putative transposase [Pirellulales bacterium]
MDQLPDAHDSFFKFAISQIECARNLIEFLLNEKELELLELETLQAAPDGFIDSDLRKSFSDLVFLVKLRPPPENPTSSVFKLNGVDQAVVCVLFEHKSCNDSSTIVQLLRYIMRITEKRLRDGLPLIPIVPIVVYHGAEPWTAARSLSEFVPCPDALKLFQLNFRYKLLDLRALADHQLLGHESRWRGTILQSVLLLLKYSRDAQFIRHLGLILAGFAINYQAQRLSKQQLIEWLKVIERYIMAANNNIEPRDFEDTLTAWFPTTYEPGSAIDKAVTKGREVGQKEGRQVGKLVGQIKVLQNLLGQPETPDEQLFAKDPAELQLMIESLKDQHSLKFK